MSKFLIALIAAIIVSAAGQSVLAQDSGQVDFWTQFDQKTADAINQCGWVTVEPGVTYWGSYWQSTGGRGGRGNGGGGGNKVRFTVELGGFWIWLSGEGRLNDAGTRIDVTSSTLIDFDIGCAIKGKYSLDLLP
jgi:hypothetical protein